MTLIIEDGSIPSMAANSYITLASATSYFTLEGRVSEWTTLGTGQEAALVRACRYMELISWKGTRADDMTDQPLEWPRVNVVDRNGYWISSTAIPPQIKWIQAELAVRFLNGDNPLPDKDTTGNIVRERIEGAIEIEYERGGYKQVPYQPYLDALLKPWIKSSISIQIFRA
jgi:hypothetical protein